MEGIDSRVTIVKRERMMQKISKIFWVFLIGSFIGYIVEMIVGLVQNGHFISRQGLLFGPFIQVYGVGLVAYYFVLSNIKKKSNLKVFLISMILGGVVEYFFSFFQEKLFGSISWDYSNLIFNIHGRTSLLHSIYWGFFGILFVKYVYPVLLKLEKYVYNNKFKFASTFVIIFMLGNITLSYFAGLRKCERQQNIEAGNAFEEFLDANYPDELINKIYAEKIKKEKV